MGLLALFDWHRGCSTPQQQNMESVFEQRGPMKVRHSEGFTLIAQLLEDDEILLSKRCLTRDAAEYIAKTFKQDYMRQGWLDVTGETTNAF